MISDTLHDAVDKIERYLTHPAFVGCYVGDDRAKIVELVEHMNAVRRYLDGIPAPGVGR